jgi:hypothetical protein
MIGLLSKRIKKRWRTLSTLFGLISGYTKGFGRIFNVLFGLLSRRNPKEIIKLKTNVGLLSINLTQFFIIRVLKPLLGILVTIRKKFSIVEIFVSLLGEGVILIRIVTYSLRSTVKNISIITSSLRTLSIRRVSILLLDLLSKSKKGISRNINGLVGLLSKRTKFLLHYIGILLGFLSRRNPREILKIGVKIGFINLVLRKIYFNRTVSSLLGLLSSVRKSTSIYRILSQTFGLFSSVSRRTVYSTRIFTKNIGVFTISLRTYLAIRFVKPLLGLISQRRIKIQKILFSLFGLVSRYSKGIKYRVISLLGLLSKRVPDVIEKIKISLGLITSFLPRLSFKRVIQPLLGLISFFGSHADAIEVFIASLGTFVTNRRIVSYALRTTTKNIKIITFSFVNWVSRRYLTSIIGLVSFKYRAKSYAFSLLLGLKNVFSRTLKYSLRATTRNIGILTITSAHRTIVKLFSALLGLTSRNIKRVRIKIIPKLGLLSSNIKQGFYMRLKMIELGLSSSSSRSFMVIKVFSLRISLMSRYIRGKLQIFNIILGLRVQRSRFLSITKKLLLGTVSRSQKSLSRIQKISVGIKSFRFKLLPYVFIVLIGVKVPNILQKNVAKILKGFSGLLGIIYFPFKSKILISTLGMITLRTRFFTRIYRLSEGFIVLRYNFLSKTIKSFVGLLSRRNIHFSTLSKVSLGFTTLNSRLQNKILKGLLGIQSNIYRSISKSVILSITEIAEYTQVYAHGYEYLISNTLGLLTVFNYKMLGKVFRTSISLLSTRSRRFVISITFITFNGLKSFRFKSFGVIRLLISRISFGKYFSRVVHNPLFTMRYLIERTFEFNENNTSLKYIDRKYELKFYTDSEIHNILL